jgi:transcription elongation factor SPT5
MAVKGKGKQVAADPPGPGADGASGSGGKRRNGYGYGSARAGPSSSSAAKRRRRAGVQQFVDDAAGVDNDYEEEDVLESEEEEASDPDDGEYGFGVLPEMRLASCVVVGGGVGGGRGLVRLGGSIWGFSSAQCGFPVSIIWRYIFASSLNPSLCVCVIPRFDICVDGFLFLGGFSPP